MSARNLANHLVEKYDLIPPVDVLSLLKQSAVVEEIEWEFAVDGLVLGLTGARSTRAFIRANQPSTRKRFTVAHEWGHIVIPWHVESVLTCHVDGIGVSATAEREREANEFASRILLPERYLIRAVSESSDVGYWLSELAACRVSAHASLIALKQHVPSGYTFVSEQAEPLPAIITRSPGTPLLGGAGGSPYSALSRSSYRSGSHLLNGKQVYWYQHIDTSGPDFSRDGSSTFYLERVVARFGDEISPGRSTRKSINGIIGGKLSKRAALDIGQMLGVLRLHLSYDDDFHQLLGDEDFDAFLAARVIEIAQRD